jgi:hypothetical protein
MDLKGLLIKGKASEKELFEKWEELVRENYKLNGGFDYLNYCDVIEGYNYLIAEYNVVKCTLIQLMFFVDDNYISELKEKGYNWKETYTDIKTLLKRAKKLKLL